MNEYASKTTAATSLERQTHVMQEMETLSASVAELRELSACLLNRLEPVLRISNEKAGSNVGVPLESLVPAADKIRASRFDIQEVNRKINDALNSLEL